MALKKGGLGTGLDALFDDNTSEIQVKKTLRIMEIEPNKSQPRKDFDDEAIANLAESIKQFGIIQPVIVMPVSDGLYRIVAGERRWRAARLAGLTEIPVIIREFSDIEVMQISLIENIQRENLSPIEEASGYKELTEKFSMTQEKIAELFGRSRSYITNSIRLLSLPEEIQDMLKNGIITVGHAKILLSCENMETTKSLAKQCAEGNLTVKQLEKIVSSIKHCRKIPPSVAKDSYYTEMELSLKEILGRKVNIKANKKGKGTLTFEFFNKDDLSEIAERLSDMSKNF